MLLNIVKDYKYTLCILFVVDVVEVQIQTIISGPATSNPLLYKPKYKTTNSPAERNLFFFQIPRS